MPAHARASAHARPPSSRKPALASLLAALTVLAAVIAGVSLTVSSAGAAAGNAVRAVTQTAPLAAANVSARGASMTTEAQTRALRLQAALVTSLREKAAAAALIYTVRPGDTLSSVAAARCGTARYWTGIYAASRARGWTARNADDITAGQRLFLACSYVPGMLGRAYVPPPVVQLTASVTPASTEHATYSPGSTAASYQAPAGNYGGGTPGGSFGQCVVARESGGNAQVMNSTGHYGLYQFAAGTWAAYGGDPADFGHASVGEQERVFASALAQGGQGNWSAYDGC